jgi:hypothetical protein
MTDVANGHTHVPMCRCGAVVSVDDETVTDNSRYAICTDCWAAGRRRWFRPDSKAERIAALERSVAGLQ